MALYQSKYTGKEIDDAIANQAVLAEKIDDAVEQIEKNYQISIRNSKQIENLKQGTADQFETDTAVAYVKNVPENALPYAEIKKIGGMTRKCINLAMPNALSMNKNGFILNTDGNGRLIVTGAAESAANVVLDLALMRSNDTRDSIPLAANVNYSWSICKNGVPLAEYTDGLNFRIDYTDTQGGVAWSWNAQDTSRPRAVSTITLQKEVEAGSTDLCGTYEVMLNEGSIVLPYEPYFEGLRSAKVTEVESVGVNRLPEKSAVVGQYWDDDGNGGVALRNNPDLMCATDPLPLKPNTTYCVSTSGKMLSWAVWFVDENYKALGRTESWIAPGSTFITPNAFSYALFTAWYSGESYQNDIMINEGTTAKTHRPYTRNTLPIPEAVQALDGYGWGVNDDVYNYIDWENNQFVKRVGKVDMGTYEWIFATNYAYPLSFHTKANGGCLANTPSAITSCYINDAGVPVMLFPTGTYGSAEDVRAAMSGVMLVYELATPEITDISDLITSDNLIEVEGGGTITFRNKYLYAVPSEVEYQVEV